MSAIRTYREEALSVFCPTCGVQPWDPCEGSRYNRRHSLHADRHVLAVQLGAPRITRYEDRCARAARSLALESRPETRPEDGRPDDRRADARRTAGRP